MSSNSDSALSSSLRISDSDVSIPSDYRTPSELFWVRHQPSLADLGYKLRPQYHPDWRPSWIRKDGSKRWRIRATFEDKHVPFVSGEVTLIRIVLIMLRLWQRINVLDAIRIKNGAKVVLRITRTHASDLSMSQYLASSDLLRNPRNHSVPILEIITIPDDEEKRVFMVMPRLIAFYEPEFHCRREFVEALRQLLEASVSCASSVGCLLIYFSGSRLHA